VDEATLSAFNAVTAFFVAHFLGDYVLQSHYMATEKVKSLPVAGVHAAWYSVPFVIFGLWLDVFPLSMWGFWFIVFTHLAIDHWRLARYLIWGKNLLFSPPSEVMTDRWDWSNCSATGYPKDVPAWLSVWLLIVTDNVLHIICNWAAVVWL